MNIGLALIVIGLGMSWTNNSRQSRHQDISSHKKQIVSEDTGCIQDV